MRPVNRILRLFPLILILPLIFLSCSGKPSNSLINEQFELVNQNVIRVLGNEYNAQNFDITEELFTNENKLEYTVKFTFELNKEVLIFKGKDIPGMLIFEKKDDEWLCTYNSCDPLSLLKLFEL